MLVRSCRSIAERRKGFGTAGARDCAARCTRIDHLRQRFGIRWPGNGLLGTSDRCETRFHSAWGPVENGYIESFNGRLRDECLNVEVFLDLADAQSKIESWKHDYNQQRPHSALADRTPQEFAQAAMQRSFGLSAAERPNDSTQDAVCVERLK